MKDWKECKLGEVCSVITDGSHFSPKDYPSQFPMASVKDLTRFGIDFSSCRTISKKDFDDLVKNGCSPEINDVLIAKDGNSALDTVCIHKDSKPVVLLSSVAILRSSNKLVPEFLRYYLDSSSTRSYLKDNFISGSAIPRIVLKDFRNVSILLPPLNEQHAIAAILSSLDDKIDLLHRQNKTLEAMAETLFRQWFVNNDELRMQNEEWNIGQVSDLIEFNPTRSLPKGTVAPYLEMANVSTNVFHPENWYDREFSSGMKFINGDTLLARITPCLENGKSSYVTFLKDGQVGWGSTEFIIMRSKEKIHSLFTYALARNRDFRDYAEGCLEGSSGRQRVNIDHLVKFEINIPSDDVIQNFNSLMKGIEPKLNNNFYQIRTLEKLRDNLLPKLMSGEVRVAV